MGRLKTKWRRVLNPQPGRQVTGREMHGCLHLKLFIHWLSSSAVAFIFNALFLQFDFLMAIPEVTFLNPSQWYKLGRTTEETTEGTWFIPVRPQEEMTPSQAITTNMQTCRISSYFLQVCSGWEGRNSKSPYIPVLRLIFISTSWN